MSQKGLAPIVIVVLIALGIGGYLVYQDKVSNPSVINATPLPTVYPSTDETTNWKTHTNTKYSLEYPDNWIIKEAGSGNQIRLFPPNTDPEGIGYKIWILVLNKNKGVNISDPVGAKEQIANKVYEYKTADIIIDGIKGASIENEVLPDSGTDGLNRIGVKLPFADNKVLYIWLMCDDGEEKSSCRQYSPVYNHILSTFKFTQ